MKWASQFDLFLPKFTLDTKLEMNSALKQLGLQRIFDYRADLSGLTGQGGLVVDAVIQKAKIEVTESGTKAAAVTGIGIVEMVSITKTLVINHPFMFLIRDKTTNVDLFMGRYSGPHTN
ncbi:hypothetical protein SNE40_021738 [Patella caerulea]|uniref:Serpin domain-containing protein n=1 Tax=Patella caerulea TaxID=87958 RepID=A0AAN8IZC7_PATCE